MSPAALKRALDPAYIGSPFAQPFQFFDGDASTPMDLTGRVVVLFLDRQGLPDAHHEITGAIQPDGRVLFTVADTSAWIKGDYSLEVRLDGASVVVGRITVAKGAGANGSDIVGAAQPPTAPGVIVSGTGVVQIVSVAPSAATDPSAILLPSDLSAALGGALTLADALLWLAQNGGTAPIVRDLIGDVVISSVAIGALSVTAAGQVLLSGAISSVSSATGSLTVGSASSIALVGSVVSTSSLVGAMTVVRQVVLAGVVIAQSAAAGALSVSAGGGQTSRMLMSSRMHPPGMNGYGGSDGVDTDSNSRISAFNELGVAVTKFRALLPNWLLTLAGEQAGFNPITVRLGFEYPAGTITPVTVGGNASAIIPVDGLGETDDIVVSWPAGAQGWFRTYVSVAAGQKWPQGYLINTALGEAADFNTGVDKSQSGTIANATGTSTRRGYGPACLIATEWTGTSTVKRVVAFGDSYVDARSLALIDAKGNFGYIGNACSGRAPYMAMGFSGSTLSTQPGNLTRRKALVAASGASVFAGQQSINDMSAGRTAAQIIADRNSVISEIKAAAPGVQVWWATAAPRTTSTDQWDTRAGQAAYSAPFAAGSGSVRGLFNADTRSAVNVDRVIELGDALEDGRDSGLWKSSESENVHILKNSLATINAASTTTVLNFVASPAIGANLFAFGGVSVGVSGANAGQRRANSANSATQATLSSALPSAPAEGDTFRLYSVRGRVTNDGLHMSTIVAAPFGGLYIGQDVVIDMLAA